MSAGHAIGRALLGLVALAGCALVAALARPSSSSAGTDGLILTVNMTSDEGDANTGDNVCDVDTGTLDNQCTLRAAIEQANAVANTDPDLIGFDIPGPGVHRIAPTDYLPEISSEVDINGYTQHGATPNTKKLGHGDDAKIKIELSGKKLEPTAGNDFGLEFVTGSAQSVLRGLAINRFPSPAIGVYAPTFIVGNFVGTDPSGTEDHGNSGIGVYLSFGGQGTTIGGSTPERRNVISANGLSGIASNVYVTVQGNYIGTAKDGVSALGNGTVFPQPAVALNSGPSTVGGTVGGAANVIAHNEGKGITLQNTGSTGHFRRNRIFGNGGIAIDLNDDGRTPNDPGDADNGPNTLLNFPILRSAVTGAHHTKISGVYHGYPAQAPYGIEFFANPPHTKQAKQYIGFLHIDTNSMGRAKFTFTAKRIAAGHNITATITDDGGETSEVSPPVRVEAR